jgi:methyl-accepting chemotaxis protein
LQHLLFKLYYKASKGG